MKDFILEIGGFNIAVHFQKTQYLTYPMNSLYELILGKLGGFLKTNKKDPGDIHATLNFVEDLKYDIYTKQSKRVKYIKYVHQISPNTFETYYHTSVYHFYLILRTILLELLGKHQGFMLHASAVAINNQAIIFTGPSGKGKSTIMKLLSKKYQPLGDDSVIIRKINNKFVLFQTPFIETEQWLERRKGSFPISRCYILKWSAHVMEESIESTDTLSEIMSQILTYKGLMKSSVHTAIGFIQQSENVKRLCFPNSQDQLINFFDLDRRWRTTGR